MKKAYPLQGGKWYDGTIKYILENPLYKGIAHYKENKNTCIKISIFYTVECIKRELYQIY